MNSKLFGKLIRYYYLSFAAIGFYRGFCNKYSVGIINDLYNKRICYDKPDVLPKLFVDKFTCGLISTGYYMNPFFHIPIIHSSIRRTEKRLRKLPLNDEDWYW